MDASHVGFGLCLYSDFPLPGMRPRIAADLPSLRIETVSAQRLQRRWSGAAGGAWRGRLGDGTELRIERGTDGDLRIANGDRAVFRLDSGAARLECAPRDPDGLAWKRVLLSRVLSLASLRRGNQALHASAVQSPHGVVAVAAPSGGGKSTLAAELISRGWPHFTDDVLVLAPGPTGPLAHPGTPHANLAGAGPGPDPHALGEILDIQDAEAWTAISAGALAPCEVAAIFLLDRGHNRGPEVSPLPASPLTLAPYMLGLPDDGEGEAARFSAYSDLARGARFLRLAAGRRVPPSELADAVERALEPEPALAVGAS